MRHIEVITTGGTIEKTYDEFTQTLSNTGSIVERMLARLQLPSTEIHLRHLMSKDSLHLTDEDRALIVETARAAAAASRSVVILHGTDTLALTGELLHASLGEPVAAIVLTGAMRPFEMERSDALQNLTEALLASTILPAGVYCVFHGQTLLFPAVSKDHRALTFSGPEYRPDGPTGQTSPRPQGP